MIGSFKILTCFFDFSKLIDSVKSSDSTRTFVFGSVQFSRFLLAVIGDLTIISLRVDAVNLFLGNFFQSFLRDIRSVTGALIYYHWIIGNANCHFLIFILLWTLMCVFSTYNHEFALILCFSNHFPLNPYYSNDLVIFVRRSGNEYH